jgi:hypothetical protein
MGFSFSTSTHEDKHDGCGSAVVMAAPVGKPRAAQSASDNAVGARWGFYSVGLGPGSPGPV